ncbi:MAG TPA: YbaB/EbfC family nucleoid-associated protein [Candidatus Limnocylindrales bacterium]
MFGDPEGMVREWGNSVDAQVRRATELNEQIEASRASADSPKGEVRVTVDSTGSLAELDLRDPAMRLDRRALAQLIMETSRKAQGLMAQQVARLAQEKLGADSAAADFISSTYAEKFPMPPDEDEPVRTPR